MALSLGEILVTIGADISELDKGLGESQIKLDNFAGVAKTAAGTVALVTAAAAAAAATIVLVTNSAVSMADRFENLSAKTAISSEALQAFDIAGKTVGLTAEAIGAATLRMSKNLFDAGAGATKALDAIGLSASQLKALSPEQQFLAVAEAVGKVENPTVQAATAMALFGKSAGPEVLAAIRSGFVDLAKEAENLGFVISGETTAAVDRFGDRVGLLGSGFNSLIVTVGSIIASNEQLGAVVETLIQKVSDMIGWVKQNEDAINSWVTTGVLFAIEVLRSLIEIVGVTVNAFASLISGVGTVIQVWGELILAGAKLLDSMVEIAKAAVAFAAGVPGLGALVAPYEALLGVAGKVTEVMKSNAQSLVDAGKGVQSFGDTTATGAKTVVGFANSLGTFSQSLVNNTGTADKAAASHTALGGAFGEAGEKASEAEKKYESFRKSLESGTVQGLTSEMAILEKAFVDTFKSGTVTAAQMDELGKKFSEAREKGAELGTMGAVLAKRFEENAQKATMAKVANELFAAAVKMAGETIKPTAADLMMFSGGLDETAKAAIEAALALGSDFPGAPTKAATAMSIFNEKTAQWNALVEQGANLAKLFGDSVGGIVGPLLSMGQGLDTALSGLSAFSAKGGGGFGGLISGLSAFGEESGGSFIKGLTGTLGNVASIAGPIASLVTTAIGIAGKVIGLFTKSEAEKIADEVSRDFGVKISEKLAKQIEETADKLDLGRFEAKLLNLADIVAEAGGAAEFGLDKLSSSIIDLQNAVALGAIPSEEGIAAIGEAFTAMAEDAVKAGEVADASLIAVVMRARELGQEIPEIAAFIADQLAAAAEGVTALIGKAFEGPGGEMQFGGIQVASVEDAQAQATIFSAAFFATLSEQGLLAAVDAFQPAFEAMQAKLAEFGAQVDFGGVARFFELAADPQFRPLLEGIDGLNQALVGLSNSGFLTRDSFAAIQQQGQASFEQLMAAGLTEQEALMQIAPLLQSQIDAANAYGFELDGNTQKLIAQAEAAGIGFKTDPMQRMVDVLEVIATKLGATAEELGAVGGAGEVAAAQVGDGFTQATAAVGEDMHVLSTTTDETYKSMIEGALGASTSVLAVGGAAIKAAGDFNSLANSARAAAAAAGSVPGPPGGDGGGRRAEGFQFGGLVTGPTLGMLGEAGPELVLPLSQSSRAIEVAGAVSAGRQAPVPMALTIQIGSETFLAEIEDATRTNRIRIHERSIQTFGD